MFRVNMNNFRQARVCHNITPEVEVSPPVGTPEYYEWKKTDDIKWAEYRKKNEEEKKLIEAELKQEKENKE